MIGARWVILRWVLVVLAMAAGSSAQGETAREIAERSETLFQRGAEVMRSDRAEALRMFDESIELLQRLIDEHGIENASIHFNMANAHAMSDRYGRAIEHYLLALRERPTDRDIIDNLVYVRGRVPDRLGPSMESSRTRRLLDAVGPGVRMGLFIAAFGAVWGLLIGRALMRERVRREVDQLRVDEGEVPSVPWWPAAMAAAVAVVFGATLVIDLAIPRAMLGVVVDAPAVARQGPSDAAYDAAFTRPVSPGVEFRVLELRDGVDGPGQWVLAEFGDRRRAWFRRGSVALVEPR